MGIQRKVGTQIFVEKKLERSGKAVVEVDALRQSLNDGKDWKKPFLGFAPEHKRLENANI